MFFIAVIWLKKKLKYFKDSCSNPDKICLIKSYWGVIAVIIIFAVIIAALLIPSPPVQNVNESQTTIASQKLLGNNSMGTVIKEGPYGNNSSSIKIAYILGQHPRESRAHNATEDNIKENSKSLQYCYYLYYINVTKNTHDYSSGRINGQKLAKEFVVPDVKQSNYNLVIDIHASNARYYPEPYIFTPIDDDISLEVSKNLAADLKWLYYYRPPRFSSPYYSTIPIIEDGTPSIIFEAYADPSSIIKQQLKEFILAVDQLDSKILL